MAVVIRPGELGHVSPFPPAAGDHEYASHAANGTVPAAFRFVLAAPGGAMMSGRYRGLVRAPVPGWLPARCCRPFFPSDDSQLAFWTAEQLLEDGGLVPGRLAARFGSRGRIFGIGQTVRAFLSAYSTPPSVM